MPDPSLYEGREQTYVKHFVLEHYLQKLAYKLGWSGGTLNYVDCFAGPWQHASKELKDTSPFIAIRELREARDALREKGRPSLKIRCLFIEKDRRACSLLIDNLRAVQDQDFEVQAINGIFASTGLAFLDSIERITLLAPTAAGSRLRADSNMLHRPQSMATLREKRRVEFDSLEEEALLFPLMSTQTLKDWLAELKAKGIVRFEGLGPRKRALKPGKGHYVVLIEKD